MSALANNLASGWADQNGEQAVPQPTIRPAPPRHQPQPRSNSPRLDRITEESPQDLAPNDLKRGVRSHSDLLQASSSLSERLAFAGDNHVLRRIRENKKPVEYTIILSSLQRMVLHSLQAELVDVTAHIHRQGRANKNDTKRATELLESYCTALQNMDYMAQKQLQCDKNGERDPFQISSREILGFRLMEDSKLFPDPAGAKSEHYRSLRKGIKDWKDYDRGFNILPGTSRHERNESERLALFLERLGMGVLGGLALIGPMLIMVLHRDLLTTLMTTSVATLLFAGALSYWGQSTKGETVLGMVAAYAAVLVVFVGSNS